MAFDFVLATLALRWFAGWYLGGRAPTLHGAARSHDTHAADGSTRISVVIPARNEAASLPALLRSLSAQTCEPAQVIVVDDQSTDATATIAEAAGATVLRSTAIPEGWIGKPWACAQGAAIATGDVLVFLDADTVASPDFLRRLTLLVRNSRGLVSVAPYHEVRRPYELASALFNLVALMGVGASSLRSNARMIGAFGPCIAMRADDYSTIGGHAGVRCDVLEDMALARACSEHGLPVLNVVGGQDLKYRMYPRGFSQLVEGWSKNFAAGARSTPVLRMLAIVAWMSGLIESGLVTSVGIVSMFGGGAGMSWPHALFYVLFALQLWSMLRRLGNLGAVAIVHPVAVVAFLGICAHSAILQRRGAVTWKERTIAIAATKQPRT
jgi:4,4'-diaponeurosporenoate glycosyltransferase